MARWIAVGCYVALALLALADAATALLVELAPATAAALAARFGLAIDSARASPALVAPIALALSGIAVVAGLGAYHALEPARRWRRTALIGFGLYGAWLAVIPVQAASERGGDIDLYGLVLVLLAFVGSVAVGRQFESTDARPPTAFTAEQPGRPVVELPSGLRYQEIEVGLGPLASAGRTAVVHYTGWLESGRQFDSSIQRGQPFSFPVGAGSVIKGWDIAVQTMRQGGQRRLIVPPSLAYGKKGAGIIPADATLVFDIELVDVR